MNRRTMITLVAGAGLAAMGCQARRTVATAEPGLEARQFGTWGVDLAGRDPKVAAGEDFYRHAVGAAHDKMVIPADRSSWGAVYELVELSENRSRAIIEAAAKARRPTGEAAQVGGLYKSFMDEAKVEALDAKPLAPALAAIRAADTKDEIAALMGRVPTTYHGAFFAPYISDDSKDPNRYVAHLSQAGLGLPDRDYYLAPSFADKKAAYRVYVAKMLGMIGWPNADQAADAIVALETEIAKASWSKTEQRDDVAMYNPITPADLAKFAPGFNWAAYLKAADLSGVTRLIVDEKSAFPKIAAIFARTDVPTLQAWQAFTTVDSAAPNLSKRFVDARFDFRSKTLNGVPEQRPRWKRGVGAVEDALGEAVGKLYVAQYFPPAAKAEMVRLVDNLKGAMRARIVANDWMAPATKTEALRKLDRMHVKIGYPDKWRDYSPLKIETGDLYGNIERSMAYEWKRQVDRINGPVDKDEWYMTPQTVNAYYDPIKNEVAFPAAFLQPPNFDPGADLAVNYGGIGATIGHEITHGFDDSGRKYTAEGVLKDWWTPADAARFDERKKVLGAQFDAFEPFPGLHVKGDLTMGENIADLGGLIIAYHAYKAALGGKPAPVLDGLTGDQRFFLSYAQTWLTKRRDDTVKQQIVSDPHAPEIYRTNGAVQNMVEFQRAFGVKPGDAMYVPPEKMARIW